MVLSSSKLKSVDFYWKIPRDLTEASLSGAGLSIVAALAMMFLFGMLLVNAADKDQLTLKTMNQLLLITEVLQQLRM